MSVREVAEDHWRTYGRNYYTRHDYEAVKSDAANRMMDELKAKLSSLPGQSFGKDKVEKADDFAYHDPVDHSVSEHQGIRIFFEGGWCSAPASKRMNWSPLE